MISLRYIRSLSLLHRLPFLNNFNKFYIFIVFVVVFFFFVFKFKKFNQPNVQEAARNCMRERERRESQF